MLIEQTGPHTALAHLVYRLHTLQQQLAVLVLQQVLHLQP